MKYSRKNTKNTKNTKNMKDLRARLRQLARRVHPLRLGALHDATIDKFSRELRVAAAQEHEVAALRAAEGLRAALLAAVKHEPWALAALSRSEPSRAVTRDLLCDAGAKELCVPEI